MGFRNKQFARVFVFMALLPTLLVGLFVYLVDPYQYYRPSSVFPDHPSKMGRYLVPGRIRHSDYDTIVVGSSMAQNFIPDDIRATLGNAAVNLAMSGSSLHEQKLVVEAAARTGKLKRVIWAYEVRTATGAVNRFSDFKAFPAYLYDGNRLNDWPYLYNRGTLTASFKKLFHPEPISAEDRKFLNSWFRTAGFQPGRETVLKKYRRPHKVTKGVPESERLERLSASFSANMIATIQAHPDVEFIVFIPPYSLLKHVTQYRYRPDTFSNFVAFQRYALKRLAGEPNVKLFDFDLNTALTGNLENYKDPSHYWIHINLWILNQFASGRMRVAPQQVDPLLDRFVAQVAAANLDDLLGENRPADATEPPQVQ